MAGLAVLIIRAADLSYIGQGTMGREKEDCRHRGT